MFSRRVVKSHDADASKSINDSGKGDGGGVMARMKKAQEESKKVRGGVTRLRCTTRLIHLSSPSPTHRTQTISRRVTSGESVQRIPLCSSNLSPVARRSVV